MKITHAITLFITALVLISCNDKSLQKYLVQKQDDPKFMKVDIPTSLLEGENSNLTAEEKEILSSIKKINVVAYPIKDANLTEFEVEKQELESILAQEQYKDLTRINSNDWSATLKYTGDDDTIDEVIVFASDNTKGFAVFRLLGENMRPEQMLQLMKTIEKGGVDLSPIGGMMKGFDN